MNDDLNLRVDRFERTVATCLYAVPALFSLQCVGIGLSGRIFEAMFADFGSPLPALTKAVISGRLVLVVLGFAVMAFCLIYARKGRPIRSVVASTVLGLMVFFLAQAATLGLFLPIFELGTVAGK